MLIPVNVERFPVCEVRCKCPTVYRCIVLVSAQIKTIFTVNTVVPPSFPTSLLPWFLNYDWQGGSVFPSTHPPLEHGSVKLTKATKGRKLKNSVFKIYVWLVYNVTFNGYRMFSKLRLNFLFQTLLVYIWQPWLFMLISCLKLSELWLVMLISSSVSLLFFTWITNVF